VVHAVLLARVAPEDADDLVQEVFMTAMSRLSDLRDGEAVGGWLCRIARNRSVDLHRARRPTEPVEEGTLVHRQPPTAEAREALAAIAKLPEAYRETLLMRLVEDLTGPEIAERTGMTAGSVRVNLHRGMALLRAELGVS
jgi:RNA polymerase sigma-70 factor (ECF subfamily)